MSRMTKGVSACALRGDVNRIKKIGDVSSWRPQPSTGCNAKKDCLQSYEIMTSHAYNAADRKRSSQTEPRRDSATTGCRADDGRSAILPKHLYYITLKTSGLCPNIINYFSLRLSVHVLHQFSNSISQKKASKHVCIKLFI